MQQAYARELKMYKVLERLAQMWWNNDMSPAVEKKLADMGWEVGEDEGSDTPSVFVIEIGDENGNSYISWPIEQLENEVVEDRLQGMRTKGLGQAADDSTKAFGDGTRDKIAKIKKALSTEKGETKEMMDIYRLAFLNVATPQQITKANKQLMDLFKGFGVGALQLIPIPGKNPALVGIEYALNKKGMSILPTAFKDFMFKNDPDKVDENFADGKKKGKSRPGRVKRSGASCNGSVTDLRKRAKNSSGEKAKMYHWCANMKSGKKKKAKESMVDEKSVSKQQQKFFGVVRAMQKGDIPKKGEAGDVAKDMKVSDVKDFAGTKHKGLPKKKKKKESLVSEMKTTEYLTTQQLSDVLKQNGASEQVGMKVLAALQVFRVTSEEIFYKIESEKGYSVNGKPLEKSMIRRIVPKSVPDDVVGIWIAKNLSPKGTKLKPNWNWQEDPEEFTQHPDMIKLRDFVQNKMQQALDGGNVPITIQHFDQNKDMAPMFRLNIQTDESLADLEYYKQRKKRNKISPEELERRTFAKFAAIHGEDKARAMIFRMKQSKPNYFVDKAKQSG